MSFNGDKKSTDTHWETLQEKAFLLWVNGHLKKRGLQIESLQNDLEDGTILINLVEILTKKRIPYYEQKPTTLFHKMSNNHLALKAIGESGGINSGCTAQQITEGHHKMILGLIWTLILHFQILDFPMSASIKRLGAKETLRSWLREYLKDYQVDLERFPECLKDGRVFSYLIHRRDPNLIQLDELEEMEDAQRLAFSIENAENALHIPRLFDAEDLLGENDVDEPTILLYLSYFRMNPLSKDKKDKSMEDYETSKFKEHVLAIEKQSEELKAKVVSLQQDRSKIETKYFEFSERMQHQVEELEERLREQTEELKMKESECQILIQKESSLHQEMLEERRHFVEENETIKKNLEKMRKEKDYLLEKFDQLLQENNELIKENEHLRNSIEKKEDSDKSNGYTARYWESKYIALQLEYQNVREELIGKNKKIEEIEKSFKDLQENLRHKAENYSILEEQKRLIEEELSKFSVENNKLKRSLSKSNKEEGVEVMSLLDDARHCFAQFRKYLDRTRDYSEAIRISARIRDAKKVVEHFVKEIASSSDEPKKYNELSPREASPSLEPIDSDQFSDYETYRKMKKLREVVSFALDKAMDDFHYVELKYQEVTTQDGRLLFAKIAQNIIQIFAERNAVDESKEEISNRLREALAQEYENLHKTIDQAKLVAQKANLEKSVEIARNFRYIKKGLEEFLLANNIPSPDFKETPIEKQDNIEDNHILLRQMIQNSLDIIRMQCSSLVDEAIDLTKDGSHVQKANLERATIIWNRLAFTQQSLKRGMQSSKIVQQAYDNQNYDETLINSFFSSSGKKKIEKNSFWDN